MTYIYLAFALAIALAIAKACCRRFETTRDVRLAEIAARTGRPFIKTWWGYEFPLGAGNEPADMHAQDSANVTDHATRSKSSRQTNCNGTHDRGDKRARQPPRPRTRASRAVYQPSLFPCDAEREEPPNAPIVN